MKRPKNIKKILSILDIKKWHEVNRYLEALEQQNTGISSESVIKILESHLYQEYSGARERTLIHKDQLPEIAKEILELSNRKDKENG